MRFPIEFELPPGRIAQEPCEPRDHSRLMVLRRGPGTIAGRVFRDLPELLSPGDLLILNDTRVLPARLLGHRQTGGAWEGLYLRTRPDGSWEMLCRGHLRPGETVMVHKDDLAPLPLRLDERLGPGRWRATPTRNVSEECPATEGRSSLARRANEEAITLLEAYGHVPLPPYIRKGRDHPADREHYQTVYARESGAVAAPTAGLHFTPELLQRLNERGIERAHVTLHVGLGTFSPIQSEDFTRHPMHEEWGRLSEATVHAMEQCRAGGGKIVAVGTTTVRVLETAAAIGPGPWSGTTEIYIYPPYRFRAIDALITNFHLPRSTLLLLVAAFAGTELLQRAYDQAIAENYRFFSYGDAMLIV